MDAARGDDAPLKVNCAAVLPVGPADRDVKDAADTLDSLLAWEPHIDLFVVDDAEAPRDILAQLPSPRSSRLEVVKSAARRGRNRVTGADRLGGLCAAVISGLAAVQASSRPDFVLKLDTDALAIGPFAGEIARAFAQDARLGVAGCYDTWPWGAIRDFPPWDIQVPRLKERVSIVRPGKGRTPRLRVAAGRRAAELRRLLDQATSNGYRAGEHCLGGAYAISSGLLSALADNAILARPGLWLRSGLGEDVAMGLCARALGFSMLGLAAEGQPFGISWSGLPGDPAKLEQDGYRIVHSVRNHRVPEPEVRAYFRERRPRSE